MFAPIRLALPADLCQGASERCIVQQVAGRSCIVCCCTQLQTLGQAPALREGVPLHMLLRNTMMVQCCTSQAASWAALRL